MDFHRIVNLIYIFVTSVGCCTSFAFLLVAFIHRRRCLNFATLLACNTALGTFLYSVVNLAAGVYMLIWDRYLVPEVDSLCGVRAYFYHSTIAWIHHSLILLALEKYCKIRQIGLLKNRSRQICFVLIQWIFDFTFDLSAFVTGNMKKLDSDNLCFVSLTTPDFVFYQAGLTFLVSDISLTFIYQLLIRHVRQVSSRSDGNRQAQMRRDLTMVRRIVLLNSQLVLVGLPVLVFVILTSIRLDLLPYKIMRLLITILNLPLSPMLVILFLITPDLRQSLAKVQNKLRVFSVKTEQHVLPVPNNGHF